MVGFLKFDREKQFRIVRKAVKDWNKDKFSDPAMLSLLTVQRKLREIEHDRDESAQKMAVKSVLQRAIEKLEKRDVELFQVIQHRFLDNLKLDVAASQLSVSVATLSRKQDKSYHALAEILCDFEREEEQRMARLQEIDLPNRDYDQLFGIDQVVSDMTERVLADDECFMLALIGMGGIGKSTIAREVACRVIRKLRFQRVLWITFSQEAQSMTRSAESVYLHILSQIANKLMPKAHSFPPEQMLKKIREILHEAPHFIIIDNLEMKDEITTLMDRLQGLIRPSKILFGSRARPFQPLIYCQDVSELSEDDAHDYFRYLQRISNAPSVSREEFAKIYQTIGGNPLMLKLTVSLLRQSGFDPLMTSLQEGGNKETHRDYRRLYWRLWDYLSEDAKEVLLCMTTGDLSVGLERDELLELSELPELRFQEAVQLLHYNALILYHDNDDGRLYNIHRVTETFVRNDIIEQISP